MFSHLAKDTDKSLCHCGDAADSGRRGRHDSTDVNGWGQVPNIVYNTHSQKERLLNSACNNTLECFPTISKTIYMPTLFDLKSGQRAAMS